MITYRELEQFGFNDKDAKVYLAGLKLGIDTVQNIAKEANIHRVTTYDILSSLVDKGLVSQTVKGKKRYFIASDPKKILDSIKDKEEKFATLLPELKAMQNKGKDRPRVMYHEGKEAVWKAYQDRIEHKAEFKENLVYGSSEKLLLTFPAGYRKFTRERLAKGIKARIIVEQSHYGQIEADTAGDQMREVKFLPEGKTFKASTIIYGDRVMIISWDNMLLAIIEDKNYAESQRMVFNLLWQYLP